MENFYVLYLDASNNFAQTKKYFSSYDEAWQWVLKNFERPSQDFIHFDLVAWKPLREELPYWAKWIARNNLGNYEVFEKKPRFLEGSDHWQTKGKQTQFPFDPVKVENWGKTLQTIDQFYNSQP